MYTTTIITVIMKAGDVTTKEVVIAVVDVTIAAEDTIEIHKNLKTLI
jgi:hypothetical protein